MNHSPKQMLEIIKSFQQLDFWQLIFLRIYYLALFLDLGVNKFYEDRNIPTSIDNIIWIIAAIGIFPFIVIITYKLINSSIIKKYLKNINHELKFKDLSLIFFMITMIIWQIDSISLWIELIIFVLIAICSEIIFSKNRKALQFLKQKISTNLG